MGSAEHEKSEHDGLAVFNYAVAFIDLLGQRNALKGEGLFTGTEDEQKFVNTLRATIGTIKRLQERVADFFKASGPNPNSPIKLQIPPEHHELWDRMQKREVTIQRWSDGLVAYSNLGNEAVKCQMNNAYELIGYCGMICWLGLASRAPLRGGLEIALRR